MSRILFLFCISLSLQVKAEKMISRIHSVLPGQGDEPTIIRFENGKVAYVSGHEKSFFNAMPSVDEVVAVELDDKNNLASVQSMDTTPLFLAEAPILEPLLTYEPSLLASRKEAEAVFKRLNKNYKRVSQCFNRAHVWSYEEHKNNKLRSMKTFVFFTPEYMRRVRFNWWFHVAPMFPVQAENGIEQMVFDFRYSHKPSTIKEWTDLFVYSKKQCRFTTKYSDYDLSPQSEDCFYMNTDMYTWGTIDIAEDEKYNNIRSEFNRLSIDGAYEEAFQGRN